MATGVHCYFQIRLLHWSGFRLRQGWTGTKNKSVWGVHSPSQPTTNPPPRLHTNIQGWFTSLLSNMASVICLFIWLCLTLFLGLDHVFWEDIILWHYLSVDQIKRHLPGSICNIHNYACLKMQNCIKHRFNLMLMIGSKVQSSGA